MLPENFLVARGTDCHRDLPQRFGILGYGIGDDLYAGPRTSGHRLNRNPPLRERLRQSIATRAAPPFHRIQRARDQQVPRLLRLGGVDQNLPTQNIERVGLVATSVVHIHPGDAHHREELNELIIRGRFPLA